MKTSIKIVSALALGALLFAGCGQPEFNRSDKGIVFKGGKPYRVPYNSNFGIYDKEKLRLGKIAMAEALKNNDKRRIQVSKKNMCRVGDVFWIETKTRDQFHALMAKGKNLEAIKSLEDAALQGKTGCARPLNKQEYSFYLNQQNQRSANSRARMQYDAATAPKTYNVNYTGTVYHY